MRTKKTTSTLRPQCRERIAALEGAVFYLLSLQLGIISRAKPWEARLGLKKPSKLRGKK